jgi:hypothetical protein
MTGEPEADEKKEKTSMSTPTTVEVHLEELGEHSWLKALANTLTGSYGSAQFRFVARPPGHEHHPGDHVATGATFPVMRWQRLDELDDSLRALGWRRCPTAGRHWWSRTYVTG